MSNSVAIHLPRSWRFAALALLQLALAALLLIQALHLNTLASTFGQTQAPAAESVKQATSQSTAVEARAIQKGPLLLPSTLDDAALAARLPRRPPMRAPARRTIFETVERRWKEYRVLGTQRYA